MGCRGSSVIVPFPPAPPPPPHPLHSASTRGGAPLSHRPPSPPSMCRCQRGERAAGGGPLAKALDGGRPSSRRQALRAQVTIPPPPLCPAPPPVSAWPSHSPTVQTGMTRYCTLVTYRRGRVGPPGAPPRQGSPPFPTPPPPRDWPRPSPSFPGTLLPPHTRRWRHAARPAAARHCPRATAAGRAEQSAPLEGQGRWDVAARGGGESEPWRGKAAAAPPDGAPPAGGRAAEAGRPPDGGRPPAGTPRKTRRGAGANRTRPPRRGRWGSGRAPCRIPSLWPWPVG